MPRQSFIYIPPFQSFPLFDERSAASKTEITACHSSPSQAQACHAIGDGQSQCNTSANRIPYMDGDLIATIFIYRHHLKAPPEAPLTSFR